MFSVYGFNLYFVAQIFFSSLMRRFLLLILVYSFTCGYICSQSSLTEVEVDSPLYVKYQASLDYLNSTKTDSAGMILDTILSEIKDSKIYDSPFGLRVRLRKAEVNERDNKGEVHDKTCAPFV